MIDGKALIAEQRQLAAKVVIADDPEFLTPTLIAGVDVGFEEQGTITRAAIVLLTYPSLTLQDYVVMKLPTTIPYIPGLLSFREVPALMAAWQQLSEQPQLVFVDGQGIAHPRRCGVASHFGLLIDTPTIGVAKSRLCGDYQPLADEPGSCQPLQDKGEQIGWVWRSKQHCHPLFISAGHRISHASALTWVKHCTQGYRLPEPTRWADSVASRRPAFLRWQATQHHGTL